MCKRNTCLTLFELCLTSATCCFYMHTHFVANVVSHSPEIPPPKRLVYLIDSYLAPHCFLPSKVDTDSFCCLEYKTYLEKNKISFSL